MRKILAGLLVMFGTLAAVAGATEAQTVNPSCTVQSIDGLTVTVEIADMRPNSEGEVMFFNGLRYYDENGNLLPNPFTYQNLDNGIHEFTLIPGDWTVSFSEFTYADDGTPGFIIGWGCDLTQFTLEDVDPTPTLEDFLGDLLNDGSLSDQQYNQLITQFNEAEAAIAAADTTAAIAHLNNLTRRADHKMFDLEADEVAQIETYVAEIISGLQ